MKRLLFLVLLVTGYTLFAQVDDESRVENQFIVLLKPGHKIEHLLSAAPSLTTQRCLSPRMNIWLLQRNTNAGADDFLTALRSNADVKLAQFNHKVQPRSVVPNDTYFNMQWNMLNAGQGGGTPGADIDATDAWAINHNNVTVNGDTIVVAIIDGLFDLGHEDLNYFINRNEIPGNGIDDDGNGYIDDVSGWNVYDTNGDVNTSSSFDQHSTHLAGIVGAIGNNNIGVAGVCWGVKILPINYGITDEAYVVASYDYAREMRIIYDATLGAKGAFVVATNSSFGINGGTDTGHPSNFPIWCAMYDSMGAVGILSAASTANVGWDIDVQSDMPTACPSNYLISVTNTMHNDAINPGAAYGKTTIDLGAPGTGIYSTVPASSYGYLTGTSMSSPHVAGTVAAMYAAACNGLLDLRYQHPDSLALLMKQYIMDGAQWESSLNNIVVSNGRLNLYRAIENLQRFNCDSCNFNLGVSGTGITCIHADDGSLTANVSGDTSQYTYLWSTGDTTAQINYLPAGFYTLNVTDTTGCTRSWAVSLHNPDTIVVSSIYINPPQDSTPGNIIVAAHAGNDTLMYSLDGVNYQQISAFSVPVDSIYTVYIKNQEGCLVERQVLVSDVQQVANVGFSFNVFPNPANNNLNVTVTLPVAQTLSINVNDVAGCLVYTEQLLFNAGYSTGTLNTATMAPGIYFITLSSADVHHTLRFAINR